jgi:hypothetical protein
LWVREAWAPATAALPLADGVLYRADYHRGFGKKDGDQKWKPSIHMRRADSRINLEITDIRVDRLNEISHHDALREGLIEWSDLPRVTSLHYGLNRADCSETSAPAAYKRLWESINGDDSWALNPWVWVVEFNRI